MVAKSKAIQFAVDLGWTKADADRAYKSTGIDLKSVDDDDKLTFAMALADFAGEVLYERKVLQRAHKAQVTRKKRELKEAQLEFSEKIGKMEEDLKSERSVFVGVIGRLYAIGRRFGLNDP